MRGVRIADFLPILSVQQHLGLYTTFHKSSGNRWAHGICVPIVLVSMMFLQAYIRVPATHPAACLLHVGTLLTVALGVVLASVDLAGAALLTVFLLPWCAIAGQIAMVCTPWIVVPIAVGVHLAAWYGTVVVGHEKLERLVETGTGTEDSNVYFRRGYYLGRNLGVSVTHVDHLIQFCIAPLSVVQDALSSVGFRRGLQERIVTQRTGIELRLADGAPPFDAHSSVARPKNWVWRPHNVTLPGGEPNGSP
ncbi:MAG: hypothetical protein IPK82_25985 [Polyangiaceae bacterium]|nr:hypothetical protein [Polyangiaceae bacterium]